MKVLNGRRTKNALLAGIEWFSHFRRKVDSLNVFPVPDGDTGKNMYHALQAAQKELEAVPGASAAEVAWAAARGAMMGGRGCSGMILSGFFAGFAEGVGDRRTLTAHDLARAFQIGCMRARERIDNPLEGTILSVGEAAAQHALAEANKSKNLLEVIVSAWKGADQALKNTTRQLKVLQENQVVDAGGMGLVYFLEGMVRFNYRQSVGAAAALEQQAHALQPKPLLRPVVLSEYKYCAEFLLVKSGLERSALQRFLFPLGKELMIADNPDGSFKVHIHIKDPKMILKQVRELGIVTWQKVDDMEAQQRHAFQAEESE